MRGVSGEQRGEGMEGGHRKSRVGGVCDLSGVDLGSCFR